MGVLAVACTPAPEASSSKAAAPPPSGALPAGVVVTPRVADAATARLCGVVATQTRAPVLLPGMAASDSAAPRLAQRVLVDSAIIGVRYLVPGAQAAYVFEGFSRDGAQRVSVRRPVVTRPGVQVPMGAPDSVIEAALAPSPLALDAELQRLRLSAPAAPLAATPDQKPALADAVPVVRDFPVFDVSLSEACPDVTVLVPMIARVDQRVRIPVGAGDVVSAYATTESGAVRAWFEETGPPPDGPRYSSVPRATVVASSAGRVTLRVSLQVVVKQQRADQPVLVRLTRRSGR
jgi:hypothetical protein